MGRRDISNDTRSLDHVSDRSESTRHGHVTSTICGSRRYRSRLAAIPRRTRTLLDVGRVAAIARAVRDHARVYHLRTCARSSRRDDRRTHRAHLPDRTVADPVSVTPSGQQLLDHHRDPNLDSGQMYYSGWVKPGELLGGRAPVPDRAPGRGRARAAGQPNPACDSGRRLKGTAYRAMARGSLRVAIPITRPGWPWVRPRASKRGTIASSSQTCASKCRTVTARRAPWIWNWSRRSTTAGHLSGKRRRIPDARRRLG